jgi:hypothetical protein
MDYDSNNDYMLGTLKTKNHLYNKIYNQYFK